MLLNYTTPAIQKATDATRAILIVAVTISSVLLFLGAFTLLRAPRHWRHAYYRLRVFQVLATVFNTGFLTLSIAEYYTVWNEFSCWQIETVHLLCYILFKQMVDFFLYERAKIVHTSLRLNHPKVILLRWGIFCSICCLAVFAPSGFYGVFGVLVLEDGTCVQLVLVVAVAIVFAVGDIFLGIAMLLMFLIPLRSHLRKMAGQNEEMSHLMEQVIQTNFIISTIVLLSGFSAIMFLCTIFLLDWTQSNMIQWTIWAYFVNIIDTIVALVCIHSLARVSICFLLSVINKKIFRHGFVILHAEIAGRS